MTVTLKTSPLDVVELGRKILLLKGVNGDIAFRGLIRREDNYARWVVRMRKETVVCPDYYLAICPQRLKTVTETSQDDDWLKQDSNLVCPTDKRRSTCITGTCELCNACGSSCSWLTGMLTEQGGLRMTSLSAASYSVQSCTA